MTPDEIRVGDYVRLKGGGQMGTVLSVQRDRRYNLTAMVAWDHQLACTCSVVDLEYPDVVTRLAELA